MRYFIIIIAICFLVGVPVYAGPGNQIEEIENSRPKPMLDKETGKEPKPQANIETGEVPKPLPNIEVLEKYGVKEWPMY